MSEKSICALCEKVASYEIRDNGKRKLFFCDTCKTFIITDTAERRLASSTEWRKQLSEKAASLADNELLHIYVPEASQTENTDKEAIKVKIEQKSKWL